MKRRHVISTAKMISFTRFFSFLHGFTSQIWFSKTAVASRLIDQPLRIALWWSLSDGRIPSGPQVLFPRRPAVVLRQCCTQHLKNINTCTQPLNVTVLETKNISDQTHSWKEEEEEMDLFFCCKYFSPRLPTGADLTTELLSELRKYIFIRYVLISRLKMKRTFTQVECDRESCI